MKKIITIGALALVAGLATPVLLAKPAAPVAPATPAAAEPKKETKPETKSAGLAVGDPAPALKVAKFVKGEALGELAKDKTYVVEFWATWCGPCKVSIPHLTKLQKEYKDKVSFIGVSVWEQDTSLVAPFVEEMGDKMDYRVAMDDLSTDKKGFMATNWLQAAGQNGIPSAFVVKNGTIAWIGHPAAMDKPLEQIVAGTFDMKKAAEDAKKEAELEATRAKEMEASGKLARELTKAMQQKKFDKALELLAELETKAPSMKEALAQTRGSIQGARFEQLLVDKKDYTAAYKLANELADGPMKDNAEMLNHIAWTILDSEGVEKRDLDLAMKLSVRSNDLTKNENGMLLDTLARAHFEKGDLAKAIEIQTKAVKFAGSDELKEQLEDTLAKYKKAPAKK